MNQLQYSKVYKREQISTPSLLCFHHLQPNSSHLVQRIPNSHSSGRTLARRLQRYAETQCELEHMRVSFSMLTSVRYLAVPRLVSL